MNDCAEQDPSFHVSLAWCVGDVTKLMNECLKDLQVLGFLHLSYTELFFFFLISATIELQPHITKIIVTRFLPFS